MKRIIEILQAGCKDSSGTAVANGTVTFYEAGTTTLKTVYQDWDFDEPHSNPATLDAAGKLKAYSDTRLKLVITNSSGSVVETIDNVGTDDSDVAGASISNAAGNGLVESDGVLSVNVDSTLTISSDQVGIASGVTLPGSPSAASNFSVGGNLAVTGTSTFTGAASFSGDVTLGDAAADNVKIGGSSGVQLVSGGADILHITSTSTKAGFKATGTRTLSVKTAGSATVYDIVTSVQPSSHGLLIVRGDIFSTGAITRGEGFTVNRSSTGTFDITFTTAFAEAPVVVATIDAAASYGSACLINSPTTTTVTINTGNAASGAVNYSFCFIAIGQRGA